MPADEDEAQPLAERVVKEAVTVGLETPMREPILEAIDEAGEGKKDPSRTVPMAGALLGLGAAAGYLLGARDVDIDAEDVPIDDFEEPDVIDDVVSGEESEEEEIEEEVEEPSGGRLRPILVGLSLVAAVALIRRKLQSGDDEWEPIEEFETDDEDDEDDEFGGDFDDDFGTDEDDDEEADDEEEEAEVGEEEAE